MKKIYFISLLCGFWLCVAQSSKDIIDNIPTYSYTPVGNNQPLGIVKEQIFTTSTGLALPAYNNSLRVNSLLDSIYAANKNIKFIDGFRIQVFNGDSKDEANAAKEYLYKIFPNADIYTVYKQPTYRIKLGDFTNKYDAKRVLEKNILKAFPKAILIPDNVFLKQKVFYE